MSLYRPLEAPPGTLRFQLAAPGPRGHALGQPAHARAHGAQGARRASAPDHARGHAAGRDPRLRARRRAAGGGPRGRHAARGVRGRVRPHLPRRGGKRRLQPAGRSRPRRTRERDRPPAGLREVHAPDRLPAVAGVHRRHARRASAHRALAGGAFPGALRSGGRARPPARAPRSTSARSRPRSRPWTTSPKIACCASTSRWCARRRARTSGAATPQGRARPFISFKFDPSKVPGLPEPKPMFEIFVYSTRFEGVHLRGGRVARGGLRWSDRPEDFRTEMLGLVKAQMVKNTVIVPVGSKGGFVLKRAPAMTDREAYLKEGVACYQDYLRGLLDITDNLAAGDGRAAAAGQAARRRRSLPRGRGGQGHGDLLRFRERRSAPSTASGSATRSPPAARRATTTRRWASPRAARGSRSSAISARWAWTRRPPTSRWPASATCRATCSATACCCRGTSGWWPRSTTATSSSTRTPTRRRRSRSASACSGCRARRGRTTTRSVSRRAAAIHPRSAKSIAITPQVKARLRPRGGRAHACRARPRHPQGAGRPHLQRRHRHVRQGHARDPCAGGRPRQRRGARRRSPSCAARCSPRAATWAARSSAASSTPRRAAGSTPTPSTTRRGSTPRTTRSTSRSCSAFPSPTASSRRSSATRSSRR